MTDPMRADGGGESQSIVAKQACTVLYAALPALDPGLLQARLQPLVGPNSVEWARAGNATLPLAGGVVQFGPHRIVAIALDLPVKQDVLDRTVAVSPMPDDLRAQLLSHKASIRLLYVSGSDDPLEQLTALYRVASGLLSQDGLGIINERAALAQPTELVQTFLPQLGSPTPPVPLWVGVVTFNADDHSPTPRYLMRTYGMEQFNLPEIATYTADRAAADEVYHLLQNTCLYMVENRKTVEMTPGHRVEFKKKTYLFTSPDADAEDGELKSPTGLLILAEV